MKTAAVPLKSVSSKHRTFDIPVEEFEGSRLCAYCGDAADERDHPVARYYVRRGTRTVPACGECNHALGARPLFGVRERAEFLLGWYEPRWRSKLKLPEWEDDDDDLIGVEAAAFREYLLGANLVREAALRRLEHLRAVAASDRKLDDLPDAICPSVAAPSIVPGADDSQTGPPTVSRIYGHSPAMTETPETVTTSPRKHKANDVVVFLRKVVANGPMKVVDIEPLARTAGIIDENQVLSQSKPFRLARAKLGIKPFQQEGAWWWALPTESASASGKKAKPSERAPEASELAPESGNGHAEGPNGSNERVEPNGSAEKTKKGHGERGPGVKTLLTREAMDEATAQAMEIGAHLTVSETAEVARQFLLGLMANPKTDERRRFEAAKELYDKGRHNGGSTHGDGSMAISGLLDTDRARIDERLRRLGELDTKNLVQDDFTPASHLTPAEETELERLHVWADTLPASVLSLTPEDVELTQLLADTPSGPSHRDDHVDPDVELRRMKAKTRPIAEVNSTEPPEPLEEGEVPEPVDDDTDDVLG
jgi:hypothetical protein